MSFDWSAWFLSHAQTLSRKDYVYLRHHSPDAAALAQALAIARGSFRMNRWPAAAALSKEEFVERARAFRALKIRTAAIVRSAVRIKIEDWQDSISNPREVPALIRSLRRHHTTQLHWTTARQSLGFDFYIATGLAGWLLSDLSTVVFGVGVSTIVTRDLLAYFSNFTALQKSTHSRVVEHEALLRRILAEYLAYQDELAAQLQDMDALGNAFAAEAGVLKIPSELRALQE